MEKSEKSFIYPNFVLNDFLFKFQVLSLHAFKYGMLQTVMREQ